MKRHNNLYPKVIDPVNLLLAEKKARKGKRRQYGVRLFDKNREANFSSIHLSLKNKTFTTSEYSIFKVFEPKERLVYRLPFKDRVVHHAIMNILEPIFVSTFTQDTYSCIKKRGIHKASYKLREALRDEPATQHFMQLDIKKFYPNIDHSILKQLLRRKIKDRDLLWLLDDIIDSADGVPIGNYLSQYFANFYLTYFDHWLKEVKRWKYYFRYADDMILLAATKEELHQLLCEIKEYLSNKLKLEIKGNWRICPVRLGIDFAGYKHWHTHTRVRKRTKKRFAKTLKYRYNKSSVAAYFGWTKHADCKHLVRKLLHGHGTGTNNKKTDSGAKKL